MPSLRVTRYLDQLAQWHGYPEKIRVDNGSEFTSEAFMNRAEAHGILIDYIKPGCPYQNAYIERFNRTCYIWGIYNACPILLLRLWLQCWHRLPWRQRG